MNNLNSINNNGVPYYFPADIAKEGDQYVRISNFFKIRVGDNGKVLPFKWYDQGRVMNVHGYIPFIQGLIGKFSTDENDEVIMAPDASYREWQGSTANAHDGGFIDYILEDQMFPQEGIFKGHFGLKDGNGNVLTSVNIIFEVLGNDLRVGETVKYYVGELENLKNQYKIQGDQAVADFNAKIESGTETDRQALDALRKSIQANRDSQASISEQQSAIMRQIKDNDIITVAQHQSDINNISTAINDRLSKMKNAPVAVKSLADLTNNYPNGADGTFLATNNQHLYVWVDNRWTDLGTYQATTLDKGTEEDLGAVKSLVLKSNLIRNGGFGYNDPSPAYAAGTAELGTFDFLGERWLTVSTKTPAAYQGVRWDIDNPFATLGSPYPLHLEFNLVTQDRMNLFVNFVGYDADNKRIGGDTGGITIDVISTKPWKFLHNSYKINVPESLISADHFTLEILQAETKSITQIRVTGIQMDVVYDTNTPQLSDNLLDNALFNGKSTHPDTMTSKTRLGSTDWIQLNDSNIRSFNGINFTFKNPYKDYQIQYPLHFEATVMSQEEVQYKVIIYGLDTNGQRIGGDAGGITIKTFTPQGWIATKISEDVFINSDLVGAENLVIQIVQPDTKALAMLRVRGVLAKVLDYRLGKSNLLDNADVAHNGLQHISANTADTILSPFKYLKSTWTRITSKGSQWAGIQYDIAGNSQNFDAPVKLSFDYLTEETMNLQLDIVYYDASGKQLGLQAIKQNWKLVANKPQSYSVTFNLNSSFRDAKRAVLQICSPDVKPIKNLNIKDVSLTNTYPSISESTWDVDKIEKMYGLPVVKIDGDFTGISHDNAKQITYEFKKAGTYISGYGTIKWQGDSSTMFPKKGYRLKTLKADYQTKDKIRVIPSWSKHSKFNLKAYYTEGMLARDPIAANIGARIWAERTDLPKDLVNEDNFGFIDGFPITLIINDTYEGVYWFNLPRPDFDYTKYAIIGSQYVDATAFEKVPDGGVKLDGSDFESLNPDDKPTAEEKKAVSDLINWVVKANDITFTADLEKHFNKNSLIDYLVFTNLVGARDAYGKNQVLLSWDGQVWYYQPYDLDCVYNANWNGTVFDTMPKYDPNNPKHPSFGDNSRLFRLLARIYYDDVCKRYTQVRQWCTPEYVLNLFKATVNEIGSSNYQREWDKWNDPAKDTEDFKQLKSAVYDHFRLADQTWLKKPSTKVQ